MGPVEEPGQRRFDAHNARGLRRFLAEYADDVVVYGPPATEPEIVGKEAMGRHYAENRFNLPGLHARLLNRIVSGNIVVDQEQATGVPGGVVGAVAVSRVKNGRIQAVWFF